jgi:hypothetical protein
MTLLKKSLVDKLVESCNGGDLILKCCRSFCGGKLSKEWEIWRNIRYKRCSQCGALCEERDIENNLNLFT